VSERNSLPRRSYTINLYSFSESKQLLPGEEAQVELLVEGVVLAWFQEGAFPQDCKICRINSLGIIDNNIVSGVVGDACTFRL